MQDIGKLLKSFMAPKPSLPAQPAAGPRTPPPQGLQAQLQEEIAFREVRKAIEGNFEQFFRGAHFVASDQAGETGSDIVTEAGGIADGILGDIAGVKGYGEVKKGFTMVANPLDTALDLAKQLTGLDSHTEVCSAIGLNTLTGLYSAVVPYLGCIKSAVGSVKDLYGAVDDVRSSFRAIEAIPITNAGGPQAALQAVNVLLDRRANDGFVKGAIQGVEAIVNTALAASGAAGIASSGVSVASKIAVLAVVIRRRAIEYKEMKEGRTALTLPRTLSPTVFSVCPLLGCYLLTGSDTSAIIVSAMGNGRPSNGWMNAVEQNKRFLDPLLDKAKSFVTDSVWRLQGPNISSKAWTADSRPWVERMWIARFGAANRGYRVIHGGAEVKAKLGSAYQAVSQPLVTLVRADLQALASLAADA